jgi:hypothetical protein
VRRFIPLLCFSYSSLALAADFPKSILGTYVHKEPVCSGPSNGPLECSGVTWNTIAIKPRNDALAYVGIDLRFRNGHSCSFYGVGRWRDKTLLASARQYGDRLKICRVTVTINGNRASFATHSGSCESSAFCSANGELRDDQLFFKRVVR